MIKSKISRITIKAGWKRGASKTKKGFTEDFLPLKNICIVKIKRSCAVPGVIAPAGDAKNM